MKFLILSILFSLILVPNVYGQTTANPSLVLDTIEIDSDQFNRILRDSPIIELDKIHAISWQVDRKSTRLNSSHVRTSRMPSSA